VRLRPPVRQNFSRNHLPLRQLEHLILLRPPIPIVRIHHGYLSVPQRRPIRVRFILTKRVHLFVTPAQYRVNAVFVFDTFVDGIRRVVRPHRLDATTFGVHDLFDGIEVDFWVRYENEDIEPAHFFVVVVS